MNDTYTIEIMPEASQAIRARAVYIQEKGNPFAAANYANGVYAYINKYLTHNPELFRIQDYDTQIRLAFYKKTTAISYIVDKRNKRVTVLNVYHTHQDYAKQLN